MQALSNIGRRASGPEPTIQGARASEVWRSIISNCAMGDTLVLDFVVPQPPGTSVNAKASPKVATFSGSVSAVVDRSKKTPKIMFRAEGFREQIQLPPPPPTGVVSTSVSQLPDAARGTDTASLLEFLTTSKLVGAAVLRRDRGDTSGVAKPVIALGTRSRSAKNAPIASSTVKASDSEAVAPIVTAVPAASGVEGVVTGPVKHEVKPEPAEDDSFNTEGEHPFFLLNTEQKRSQFSTMFERLYVDEPVAVHLGATMLLSMLSKGETAPSSPLACDALSSGVFSSTRFQGLYTRGSVGPSPGDGEALPDEGPGVLPIPHSPNRGYEDDDTVDVGAPCAELREEGVCVAGPPMLSDARPAPPVRREWDDVGSGAFAYVYKVSSGEETTECSSAAVKLVRGLLHTSEEHVDESQLGLFQRVASELRSHLVPEHVNACPSVIRALGLPTKAVYGLAKPSFRALRAAVGLSPMRDGMGQESGVEHLGKSDHTHTGGLFQDQLRPSYLRNGQHWYEHALPVLEDGSFSPRLASVGAPARPMEIVDVLHMEDQADAHGVLHAGTEKNKGGPRAATAGRVSFFPFDREVELLLEWKELMESELQKGHPNPSEFTRLRRRMKDHHDDEDMFERRAKKAHRQHCYSFFLGTKAVCSPSSHELLPTAQSFSNLAKSKSTLSVADIFASRKVVDPAAACGMTIHRPYISPCRVGFTSGALGIRQSAVGELFNLQLCTGKAHVVRLRDWGYRGSQIDQFAKLSLSFLMDMIEHTHVGKSELLDMKGLVAVSELLGKKAHVPAPLVTVSLPMQSPTFVSKLASRQLRVVPGYVDASAPDSAPPAKNMPFSLQDPLFPSLEHLVVCSQAQLSSFGLTSLLEGTAGIVMPFCDQPLNKLQRRVGMMVQERRGIAEMVNTEARDRLTILQKMHAYLEARRGVLSSETQASLSYLPRRPHTPLIVEPTFDNPFGYSLSDEATRGWIAMLPQLEAVYEGMQPGALVKALPGGGNASGGGLATLEDGVARYLLPPRFTDRCERVAFTTALLRDLVPALESLHSTDVVHRDVKPNNIMVVRQASFQVGLCDDGRGCATEGMQSVPRLFFDFLAQPFNLLERSRCSFELIDLGWGRILPTATIGVDPLPMMQRPEDDTDSAEGEGSQNASKTRESTACSREEWDDYDAKNADVYVDAGEQPAPAQQTVLMGQHQISGATQALLVPATGSSYSNPLGAKRPREDVAVMDGPLTYRNIPMANLPPVPAAPAQRFDPRLFSMQRKAAAFQKGVPLPTGHLPANSGGLLQASAADVSGYGAQRARGLLPAPHPVVGAGGVDGLSFSDLEKAPFPLPLPSVITAPDASASSFSALASAGPPEASVPPSKCLEHEEDGEEDLPTEEADDVPRDFLLSGPAGNMCYRAPEFMLGSHEHLIIPGASGPDGPRFAYGPSIDVFALGAVLFESLTGTRFLKVRPRELESQDLRNGVLLQRMVESLGYPKVWVAEVVAQMRGIKRSAYPPLILLSPYATARIRSASSVKVAHRCMEQLEVFFAADSIRRNRIIDASTIESAIAFAWDEVVTATTTGSKMHSMSDMSGSTGTETYCEADNDLSLGRDGPKGGGLVGAMARLRPYAIVPVRLLGQHGLAGIVYQQQEAGTSVVGTTQQFGGLRNAFVSATQSSKRPSTSAFVLKHLQHSLRPAWAYEPRTPSRMGFRALSEVGARDGDACARGTFSGVLLPKERQPSQVTTADCVTEIVGLISRMLAWEPSERPTMREIQSSGCFELLCGGDRGQYNL